MIIADALVVLLLIPVAGVYYLILCPFLLWDYIKARSRP